jgi:hypothetical protein
MNFTNSKKLVSMVVAAAVAALCTCTAATASPVYTFTNTPDAMTGSYTFKQKFVVGSQNIVINSLGFYDYLSNGLAESHLMGLFDNAGNLLISTTISSGTGSTLIDGFRWKTIADTTLTAGSTFSLISQSNLDAHNMVAGITLNPEVISVEGGYGSGATFNPNLISTSKDNIIWTGNFNIADTQVPEPASLALMGLGLAALAVRPRKRKVA